ncbi:LLM class flavin-dependent oxidoreductase [Halobacteriovorax sp. DA5]|uniref:LLM class flavin-dependent oxidoreductase n=1 Tax=Halobacteriovorax sp. DA5 TaxID=2067553 RepID=UPI000CD1919D|nr:LLM class flavin-dependent oxidoreductase [Halobacteriovorax sp. DA5]POB13521.1 alkane 1-monooxygenase [Halobacteriovorax sp. DA5]
MTPKLSILDLVFVNEGQHVKDAFDNSVRSAQAAEEYGYNRIWVAEHHNMPAIASAATSVVIGLLASQTKTIRIGAGGIMLPNHSPLVIAEQFGTLEALYPGRIDLGLGRAPGTDQMTVQALRTTAQSSNNFPQDIVELQRLLSMESANDPIVATPGLGSQVPLWILGSSTFGAQLAAHLGLPYAFASHFAPDAIQEALSLYHAGFEPSAQQDKPYVMLGVNIIIADTDEEAQFLSTSQKQSFANLRRGLKKKFQAPIEDMDTYWDMHEKMMAQHMLHFSFVGSKETVKRGLDQFIERYRPDELMVVTSIFDNEKKIKSLKLLSEIFKQ